MRHYLLPLLGAFLVYIHSRNVTVDPHFSIAEAMAVDGGKFAAVGQTAEIRKLAGPATCVVDLRGGRWRQGSKTVTCTNAGGGPGVDLPAARSLADVLAAVSERVKIAEPGSIVVSNGDWHEAQ